MWTPDVVFDNQVSLEHASSAIKNESDAAAEIIAGLSLRGAVLVRLGVDDAAALASLLRYSSHFFEKPHGEKAYVARDAVIPAVGPAAVRVGWRQPSASKELLRCFRGHPLPLPVARGGIVGESPTSMPYFGSSCE